MSKRPTPDDQSQTVASVAAVRHFKHDGRDVRPGDTLRVAVADAVELVAVGAAAYARRDMQAK